MADKTEIASLAAFMRSHTGAEIEYISSPDDSLGATVAILPDGKTLTDLKPFLDIWRDKPERIFGTSVHETLTSLLNHIEYHNSGRSACFLSMADSKAVVIYDYHVGTECVTADGDSINIPEPNWRGHRAEYAFPLSREWRAWTRNDRTKMTMAEFSAFIDDRITDLMQPPDLTGDLSPTDARIAELVNLIGGRFGSPLRMRDLARGFTVNESAVASISSNPDTGEHNVVFRADHETGEKVGEMAIPNLFAIAIPVFHLGPLYRVVARLRYRKAGAGINMIYELQDPDKVLEHAYQEAGEAIRADTGVPVFFGTGENLVIKR